MGKREGYGHPFASSDRGRANELRRAFRDALAACGLDTPKALAREIGVSERTARKYINDPETVTEDAFNRMMGSDRLAEYVACARYGVSMDYAQAYVDSASAFDSEIPDMTKRLIGAYLRLPKGLMGDALHLVEAASRGAEQSTGESITCNWIRGKVAESGLMSSDELPLDSASLPEDARLSAASIHGVSTDHATPANGQEPESSSG